MYVLKHFLLVAVCECLDDHSDFFQASYWNAVVLDGGVLLGSQDFPLNLFLFLFLMPSHSVFFSVCRCSHGVAAKRTS